MKTWNAGSTVDWERIGTIGGVTASSYPKPAKSRELTAPVVHVPQPRCMASSSELGRLSRRHVGCWKGEVCSRMAKRAVRGDGEGGAMRPEARPGGS
jgi:hypothetical protein